MAITLILHEATRTGAPRVGGLIARELARAESVDVVVLRDGPLVPWLVGLVGEARVHVCEAGQFTKDVTFARRFEAAKSLLTGLPGDLVYVNSLAASVFVPAARALGRHAVLHVHEKAGEIYSLLQLDMTKIETLAMADGVVLAAEDLAGDLEQVFGRVPAQFVNFGIVVDMQAVLESTAAQARPPRNAAGAQMVPGPRLVVGMCGHASPRKGADIFLAAAEALPQCDFVWIGAWAPDEAPENRAYAEFHEIKLDNFHVTGAVDNPFACMRLLDMFFLSSREDPNPLVLAEALALRIPILCFSETTAVATRLGRSAILCHGKPNADDAVRVLARCAVPEIRAMGFRGLVDSAIAEFDPAQKIDILWQLFAAIRTAPPGNRSDS